MVLSQPLIELHGITKQFGGAHALREVNLSLYPHEVHALVGENGAGKSTLVKILGGVHTPDAGEMLVDGEPVTLHSPNQAQRLGIAVIHQHPTLFPDLDVAENTYMGHHPVGRLHQVDWKQMYAQVDSLLATLGVQFTARTPVRSLSVADQQLVEIAKALNVQTRVLVMDEPTAALSPREVHELFAIVRRLREQGVAILFVSHRLEEVFELADRITILRDGSFVISTLVNEMTPEAMIRYMVGREIETLFPKQATTIGRAALAPTGLCCLGRQPSLTPRTSINSTSDPSSSRSGGKRPPLRPRLPGRRALCSALLSLCVFVQGHKRSIAGGIKPSGPRCWPI